MFNESDMYEILYIRFFIHYKKKICNVFNFSSYIFQNLLDYINTNL